MTKCCQPLSHAEKENENRLKVSLDAFPVRGMKIEKSNKDR
jgi:hypothetical protein